MSNSGPAIPEPPKVEAKDSGRLGWAQLVVNLATALLVLTLNVQTQQHSTQFDQSVADAQIVRDFVADLSDAKKSDLALIALYYHGQETRDSVRIAEIDALATSIIVSGIRGGSLTANTAKTRFAYGILSGDNAQADLAEVNAAFGDSLPSPTLVLPSSNTTLPHVAVAGNGKLAAAAAQSITGKATVYIQYSTAGSSSNAVPALKVRAESLLDSLKANGGYLFPKDVLQVNTPLRGTSVRYYWDDDKALAVQLTNAVQTSVKQTIDQPLYNGPADVPKGHLEIWLSPNS